MIATIKNNPALTPLNNWDWSRSNMHEIGISCMNNKMIELKMKYIVNVFIEPFSKYSMAKLITIITIP